MLSFNTFSIALLVSALLAFGQAAEKPKSANEIPSNLGTDIATALLGTFFPSLTLSDSGKSSHADSKSSEKRQLPLGYGGNPGFPGGFGGNPGYGFGLDGADNFLGGYGNNLAGFGNPGFAPDPRFGAPANNFAPSFPGTGLSGGFEGLQSPNYMGNNGLLGQRTNIRRVEANRQSSLGGGGGYSNLANFLSGLQSQPPTVNYPFYHPQFGVLNNPALQQHLNLFGNEGGGGHQGRTDLPSSYVYPFAQQGTPILPNSLGNPIYGLGPSSNLGPSGGLGPGSGPGLGLGPSGPGLHNGFGQNAMGPSPLGSNGLSNYGSYGMNGNGYGNPTGQGLGGGGMGLSGLGGLSGGSLGNLGGGGLTGLGANYNGMGFVGKRALNETEEKEAIYTASFVQEKAPADPEKLERPLKISEMSSQPLIQESLDEAEPTLNPAKIELPETPCDKCISIDFSKLLGPWTQIFGNDDSLQTIYSGISMVNKPTTQLDTNHIFHPTCIGWRLEIPSLEGPVSDIPITVSFNDTRTLHKVKGSIMDYKGRKSFSVKLLSNFVLPLCVVDAGPRTSSLYEYMILMEIVGKERCKNMHVFARKSQTFFRDHSRNISKFLRNEIKSGDANPVGTLIDPDSCGTELPLFPVGINRS